MEVPERMLECIFPFAGDQAARIFNPGATTSGCNERGIMQTENKIITGDSDIVSFQVRNSPSGFLESRHLDLSKKKLLFGEQVEILRQSSQRKS